jgi:hypothetical protein
MPGLFLSERGDLNPGPLRPANEAGRESAIPFLIKRGPESAT